MTSHSKYNNCWECGINLPPTNSRRQNPTKCKVCSNQNRGWKMKTNDFKPSVYCEIEQSRTAFA